MKNSVISDIFHGKRGRSDMVHPTQKMDNLTDKMEVLRKKFIEKLSEELIEEYTSLSELIIDYQCEEVDMFYVEGYKTGIRIGVESAILAENESLKSR